MDPRLVAVKILEKVIYQKQSLTFALAAEFSKQSEIKQRNLIQEICYGVLRWYYPLTFLITKLLEKPLKTKDADLQILLLIGLYQLIYLNIPSHAAVSSTVSIAQDLKKSWATKLINGVLRQFLRNQETLLKESDSQFYLNFSHPEWLTQMIKEAWPDHWQTILSANNERPPFCLRVNSLKISKADYIKLLPEHIEVTETPYTTQGIILNPALAIKDLPHFAEGFASIQDSAAQLAAELLDLAPHQRVLDACAAPGSKTTHLLELQPKLLEVVAIDHDSKRLERVQENLSRLNMKANLICSDAGDIQTWWDGNLFDRILLDAPCSATGVIRRHPDIKLLKNADDINQLSHQQYQLLEKLWPLLKTGGKLLYCTCSILPQENYAVLSKFISTHTNVKEEKLTDNWGFPQSIGRQILPGMHNMDGFYYARLIKVA